MTHPNARTHQRGAVSIEFAFIFMLVMALFYGMVGYVVPLLMASSYQEVAADAAREAVLLAFDHGAQELRQQVARDVVADSWLPADWTQPCSDYPSGQYLKESADRISACIRHSRPSEILPQVSLFGWRYPVLPAEIRGEATILRRSTGAFAP